jgi:hypothetical protein
MGHANLAIIAAKLAEEYLIQTAPAVYQLFTFTRANVLQTVQFKLLS